VFPVLSSTARESLGSLQLVKCYLGFFNASGDFVRDPELGRR
jgi:hypothetical protein